MKEFKDLSFQKRAYLVYVIPALVIHELSHILMGILFLRYKLRINYIKYDKETEHWSVSLHMRLKQYWPSFFMLYAPMISIFFFLIFGFQYHYLWIIFIYQITCDTSFPSYLDEEAFLNVIMDIEQDDETKEYAITHKDEIEEYYKHNEKPKIH